METYFLKRPVKLLQFLFQLILHYSIFLSAILNDSYFTIIFESVGIHMKLSNLKEVQAVRSSIAQDITELDLNWFSLMA